MNKERNYNINYTEQNLYKGLSFSFSLVKNNPKLMALAINIEDLLNKQKIEFNRIEFKKKKAEYDRKY